MSNALPSLVAPGGPVTQVIRAARAEHETSPARRGFLRGLLALPLVGGGISLIGAPSAVAAPVTADLLGEYADWLIYEHAAVVQEIVADAAHPNSALEWRGRYDHAYRWHRARGPLRRSSPSGNLIGDGLSFASDRAALVLSAVGCDWR